MADISEEVFAKEIEKILKIADLSKISTKKVIQLLEKSLGVDLSKKKKVIDQLVMDYVNKHGSEEEDGEDEEEEEVEKEEKHRALKRSVPPPKGLAKKSKKDVSEDDDDASNESESEEEKKPAARRSKRRKGSSADSDSDWGKKKEKSVKPKKAGGRGKGRGSGYTRAYKLSPELAELMGQDSMPRHEVVKKVWSIIKEKKLYDPNNKQFAICNDELYKVFGIKRFRTFGMMKYLKTHFIDE